MSPMGFKSNESIKCPLDSSNTERVLPQEGQAVPVVFLKMQGVKVLWLSIWYAHASHMYPTATPAPNNRYSLFLVILLMKVSL